MAYLYTLGVYRPPNYLLPGAFSVRMYFSCSFLRYLLECDFWLLFYSDKCHDLGGWSQSLFPLDEGHRESFFKLQWPVHSECLALQCGSTTHFAWISSPVALNASHPGIKFVGVLHPVYQQLCHSMKDRSISVYVDRTVIWILWIFLHVLKTTPVGHGGMISILRSISVYVDRTVIWILWIFNCFVVNLHVLKTTPVGHGGMISILRIHTPRFINFLLQLLTLNCVAS